MSIFTTRKGLAVATLVAVGSSLFAGLPAHAASLVLAPTSGTVLALPAGDTFSLQETASSEVASSNFGTLKVKIVNTDGVLADAWLNSEAATSLGTTAGGSTTLTYTGSSNNNIIHIDSKNSSVTSRYAVTAFLDINANGSFDTATDLGSTQTITFYKAADLAVTTAFVGSVFKNATTAPATVNFTNVNKEQLVSNGNSVKIAFTSGLGADYGTGTASYNSSTKLYEASSSFAAVAAGSIVRAQAKLDDVSVGSQVGTTVLATAINSLTASTVVGTTAAPVSGNQADVSVNGAYQLQVVAKDDAATPAPVAGRAVSYKVETTATLSSTVTLTVNGVTYTDNTKLPGYNSGAIARLSSTTDSSGKIVVSSSSVGFVAGQSVTFTFYGDTDATTTYLTANQAASVFDGYITNYDNNYVAVTAGTAVDVNVAVYDQFGNAAPNAFDVRAQLQSSSRTTTNATNATNDIKALTGGKATLRITDNGAGTGTNYYKINFIQRDPVGGGYGSFTENVIASNFEVRIVSAADTVPGVVSLGTGTKGTDGKYSLLAGATGSSTNAQSIGGFDFGAYDSRNVLGSAPSVDANYVTISGTVTSSSTASYAGVPVVGAKVTINGPGLQFRSTPNGGTVYTVDSSTVTTDGSGNFSVRVWSHKSGAQTLSVTSGSVTSQIDVYFGSASADAGSTLVIDAPVYTLPGKSVVFTATLTDKYGNPVTVPDSATLTNPDFKLSVTGIGNIGPAALYTNSEGKAVVAVSLGANELGSLVVTATYDADGTGTESKPISVSKTVQVSYGAPVPSDAKVTISAPTSAQSGRSVDVQVTVTDKDGKAVPDAYVTVSALGVGYLVTPTAITDSNGKTQFKLVVGAGESGVATLTATAGVVKTTATTNFGITDANINKVGKRVTVDWAFASGKRLVITRNGVQIKNIVVSSDEAAKYSFNLKKGTWKIVVKLGSVTMINQTYKIK
ncbi:MAG: beta strand repeat-containing protein [Micrococcales bacterium]